MANTTAIEEVVDPKAIEQFIQFKAEGKSLREQLVLLLNTVNDLNIALGGSTPATFAKNLKATNDAATQLIATNKRIEDSYTKTEAKKEEIINKYLISLSKQSAAEDKRRAQQEANDAKEIQQAETKAAKLQAIADRKANTQFPDSQTPYNPATTDDNPAVRYEPIITGQENMTSASTQATTALNAETAAMATQAEGVEVLSAEYRANIELLLELQAERAANVVELKELTAVDAASGERVVLLTAAQARLKVEIAEATLEINRQTKQMLAADGAIKELDASVLLLSTAYESLSIAERQSEAGQKMGAELAALRTQQNELGLAVKNTKNNVGNYTDSINKSSVGVGLADRITNQFTRSIIRMGVQFALIGVAFKGIEWLYNYIKALDIFNDVATTYEIKQKALTDAFSSSDYTKGVENVEKLAASLDLAKGGIIDSDKAINEYNETIGKTFGYVNNLNDAQQGFISHSDAYIQTLYLEAAAQAALADSSKFAAETLAKNVELQVEKSNIDYDTKGAQQLGFSKQVIQNQKDQSKALTDEIANNNKRVIQSYKNTVAAIKDLYKSANQSGGNSSAGTDAVNDLRTKIANEQLEYEKIIAQNKINNDKLSYKTRLAAIDEFYKASAQIEKNNENAELVKLPANDARREDIEKDTANKLLSLQETANNQRASLNDKAYKQDQEILKNNLEKQKDLFKSVTEDPNISYEGKLAALELYRQKSLDIIKANYTEQKTEAGKNLKSVTIAQQAQAKSELELKNEVVAETEKLAKEETERLQKEWDKRVKIAENAEKLAIDFLQSSNDDRVASIETQANKEIAVLDKKYSNGLVNEKKYHAGIKKIQDQANIDKLGSEAFFQQSKLEILQAKQDADIDNANQFALTTGQDPAAEIANIKATSGVTQQQTVSTKANAALGTAVDNSDNDAAKAKRELAKERMQAAFEAAKASISDITGLLDKGYENQIKKLETVGKLIDENAEIQKDAVNRGLDTEKNKARQIDIINAQTVSAQKANQERINAVKTKEAKADKAAAIAEIILGTAQSIAKVSYDPVQVALAAALGAVQLGIAIATPLPQFAKGGITPGGKVIVGEKGIEHGRLPSGHEFYTPGVATIMDLPKGTKITPHHMLPEMPQWVGNRTDNSDVVAAVDRLYRKEQPKQGSQRLSGWITAQRQADAWNRYAGQYFK